MKTVVGLGFAFLALSAGAVLADFDPVGGSGNRQDRDKCPSDTFLVGAKFRSGAWLDRIQILCAKMEDDGTVGAPKTKRSSRGGTGGAAGEVYCPKDQVVFGMRFTLTPNRQVNHVRFFCANRDANQGSEIEFGGTATHADAIDRSCGPAGNRQAATGLTINSGAHVNALGLMCGSLPRPVFTTKKSKGGFSCAVAATRMGAMVKDARARDCSFLKSGVWDKPGEYWMKQCLTDSGLTKINEPVLNKQLEECKALTGAGAETSAGRSIVTALQATDVYANNNGDASAICTMNAGDKGELGGLKISDNNWVLVRKMSGADCVGKQVQQGWVWNGGSLDIKK